MSGRIENVFARLGRIIPTQPYLWVLLGSDGFHLCLFFPHIRVCLPDAEAECSSWSCWLGHRKVARAVCEAASNLVGGHSGTGRERFSQSCRHFIQKLRWLLLVLDWMTL